MTTVSVKTSRGKEMKDVTGLVKKAVSESGVDSGLLVAYVPHTTAGITINEIADPDVPRDILAHLEKLVPANGSYRHTEGNADSHIQSSLVGSSVLVIVENGRLVLGTWQGIFFCEFDRPRSRKLHLEIIPR